MYVFAFALLLLVLLAALGGGGLALLQLWQGRDDCLRLVEKAHLVISAALTLASALLLHALYWNDFSVQYVAHYTDRILPVFYRLTAFWAGQPRLHAVLGPGRGSERPRSLPVRAPTTA